MRLASRLSLVLLAVCALLAGLPVQAQVSLTTLGVPYTQNFDTLPASGSATWTNNSTIPGWFHARTGTGTTIVANDGSSNAGNLYSYGTGTATDRALGSLGSGNAAVGNLFWGVRLQNNTGATITTLDVSYTGEQWRNSAAAAQTITFSYLVGSPTVTGSLAEFQSAGVAVASLDFTSPITGGAAGALNGNLAANRMTRTFSITGLSIPNGTEVMLRWADPDHTGADHGLSIDDFSVTPQGGIPMPTLNVNDVALAEGDPPGTTTFTFTVSLTAPAGPGGVTFDIATADNTATTANNDYVTNSLTGQTIPAGSSTYAFNVTVNRDTMAEANETFFVNVTSIVGANAGDTQGQGTINNDDVTLTPIHDIQGPGASSPIVGATVTTRGIVTGVRSNGFFIQEPDATVDADPATSEGVLVFGSPVPAGAVVGALVQVTGTVAEFVPTQDPLQPPLTELTSATTVQISTGNPLPAAIPLTATFPDPAGPHDQLERLEGMRVSVASLTVIAPTMGNVNEANATATSNGVFFGVVTGVPRPFREPGIQAPDPAPSGGSIPPIPRFDSNPERIRVDSDGLVGGPLIDVGTGAVVTGLAGPLDYTFRTYTILPDPGATIGVTGGPVAIMVATPTAQEFTVASYNLERFFDTVNDPAIGEPVLTPAAFDMRLNKASLAIRNFLKTPDILGVVEVENLTTLQALAARISADAVAASQPDPEYDAFLVEGNDVGGIDVGFLVKTSVVFGTTPRIEVVEVQQELDGTLFVNPDSSTETLNDRPPLRLNAIVHHPNGASFPVTVIVNHLRSLIGVNVEGTGSNGWPSSGARIRAKRLAQAEDLAGLVQARQTADPNENIILVGDFNAFEFNDGLADVMNVIAGTPPPDNETAVPGDGMDLVTPDLDNLDDTAPPAERYSYTFDGSAQTLDHVLINQPLIADTTARRIEHPRLGADFPQTARNDGTTPLRLSDHDPVVAYFQVPGFATAGVTILKVEQPGSDPVAAGTNLTYTINVSNAGPDTALNLMWSDTLPAGTTFVSLAATPGWTCTTPAVGAGGTVSCSIGSQSVGTSVFTLTVNVGAGVAMGTVLSNTATVTTTTADDPSDNSSTETTTVGASADLSVTKTDAVDPVPPGTNVTYTITVSNAGPSNAANVSLSDPLPAGTTFVSLAPAAGWTCTTPAVGAPGTVTCSIASLASGSAVFTLVVAVDPAATGTLSNTATVSSAASDPNPANNSATATTLLGSLADVSVTKVDNPDPVLAGANLTYTITAGNAGPSNAPMASLTDPLPAGTTFVSLASPAGWSCTTPAVGAGGTVTCTHPSMPLGSAVFTLVVQAGSGVANGTVLSNTATITAAASDLNPGNETATVTTTVTNTAGQASVTGTKSASGSFTPGSTVTYTVVLSNAGPGTQQDNPGDEFTDVLPASLTLAGATATSGTAVPNVGTNTVTWNGSIPASGSVTITITATVSPAAAPGTTITNQGNFAYDADGNGTNEASGATDNPATPGADSTSFVVAAGGPAGPANIPTLDEIGLALLVLLLAVGGALTLRRRRV